MKKQQYINVYLTLLCVTEQHGIFIFNSKFEKEEGKSLLELAWLQVFCFFFFVCVCLK